MKHPTPQPDFTCAAARDAWHAACDGELAADAQAALDAHVAACPACRAYIDDLAAIAGALAELRTATQRVGAAPARPTRRHATPWLNRLTRMAAAIALVLGAGVLAYLATVERPTAPTHTPTTVAQPPAPAGPDAPPPVAIALAGDSDERFIPVARATQQSNVHVFVLFERP
ncbi:MAG TPA: zf-HC2 domain-containing protein [Phycisphaerae bacterium]|nr:zf-HC2 domain-containing protein [Phycisphaerae bacterium]